MFKIIDYREVGTKEFKQLKVCDCFMFGDCLCIKIDSTRAFNLTHKSILETTPFAKVTPVDATITITSPDDNNLPF